MTTMRADAADYYSLPEALRAADQLIELLQREYEKGFFQLDDVILRSGERDLVFSGPQYLAFARRGLADAMARARTKKLQAQPE